MTSEATAGNRIVGTLRTADGKGVVRMEDHFDTVIDDLWSALTDSSRLARWLGEFDGALRVGGEFKARFFASGWEGTGRVDVCVPPYHLVVTSPRMSPDEGAVTPGRAGSSSSRPTRPSHRSRANHDSECMAPTPIGDVSLLGVMSRDAALWRLTC
jgi:uncharacterized protein YndB with AHSA1/START domain